MEKCNRELLNLIGLNITTTTTVTTNTYWKPIYYTSMCDCRKQNMTKLSNTFNDYMSRVINTFTDSVAIEMKSADTSR